MIQRSLREAISKDVTVLTIAHRLQTIMDADKIVSVLLLTCFCFSSLTIYRPWHSQLVLDSGRIVSVCFMCRLSGTGG